MPDLPNIPEMGDSPEINPKPEKINWGEDLVEDNIKNDTEEGIKAGQGYFEALINEAAELALGPEVAEVAKGVERGMDIINHEILEEGKSVIEDMSKMKNEIPVVQPENIKGPEKIDWGEELIEPLDGDTENFLNENGYEGLAQEFTPEQRAQIMEMLRNNPNLTLLQSQLEALPTEEQDRFKEFAKLMLRIAVKVAAETAAAIAKNIAKSSDNKTTKVIFGTIGDLTKSLGGFADSAITGEEKPNLGKDFGNYVRDYFFNRSGENPNIESEQEEELEEQPVEQTV